MSIAIVVHGQNGTRMDGLRDVDVVHDIGMPVLDITYRNDVGAPDDPSGRLQYGATEVAGPRRRRDLGDAKRRGRRRPRRSVDGRRRRGVVPGELAADRRGEPSGAGRTDALARRGRGLRGARRAPRWARRAGPGDLGRRAADLVALRRGLVGRRLRRRHLVGAGTDARRARHRRPPGTGDALAAARCGRAGSWSPSRSSRTPSTSSPGTSTGRGTPTWSGRSSTRRADPAPGSRVAAGTWMPFRPRPLSPDRSHPLQVTPGHRIGGRLGGSPQRRHPAAARAEEAHRRAHSQRPARRTGEGEPWTTTPTRRWKSSARSTTW